MRSRSTLAGILLLAGSAPSGGAEPDGPTLDRRFDEVVRPFLRDNCLSCHGPRKQEGQFDLSGFQSAADVAARRRAWDVVLDRLEAEEMPPEEATRRPTPPERRAVIDWIRADRDREARKNAGDPGTVLARRLSNAEYDRTIRDLTGVDIRPTREFPVDPANEAGFDNSGESLAMSPALVKKYLAAARLVADHLILKPDGFAFAPEPAVAETDRDKYCVRRIVAFYERHRVDYADYFHAAWRSRSRAGPGDLATETGLSADYLARIRRTLEGDWPATGPLGELQALWRALPADPRASVEARRGSERMRDLVVRLRKGFEPKAGKVQVRGISAGSQPFVLWRNRRLAEQHMRCPKEGASPDLEEFCRVFPDAFFVSERAPYFDPRATRSGRPLTAGFHLMQGYFRDDAPLYAMVLDDAGRREIDALWRELNFATRAPIRQYKDFIFFERAEPPRFAAGPEFDFARSEDKDATSGAKMEQLRDAYLARARKNGADETAVEAIGSYFAGISAEIRQVERDHRDAEPAHLAALARLATRAYRRPLSPADREDLLGTYRDLRDKEGLDPEDAVRDSVVILLMSPRFLYRSEPAVEGEAARPLSDHALASRLSYFLWSSMPDDELTALADAGHLHDRAVLVAQARRMLRDARVRGLAEGFAGQWLDIRRFEEHNGVDRGRFPAFTNELRGAMYEEPIRFFVDLAGRDGPVLDLLDADHTFVNPILARHYGMPVPDPGPGPDGWARVDGAARYGRGGLLPMSAFLTASSPGLRTSPVRRGYWVVRRILGEEIPAPPPDVPELPRDEAKTGDLTLPQLLARHRENPSCAGCHRRFDSIGLAFEGYGPIGERRDRDLGGRPVDPSAILPDGRRASGLDGLRGYLADRRRDDFLDNLSRKLLAYALGRSPIPSDDSTVRAIRDRLAADDHRFGGMVESIVTSPQFRDKRGRDDPRDR